MLITMYPVLATFFFKYCKSCALFICEDAQDVSYQWSKTTFLLVLTLTKVRLCTSDPPKLHPRWKPFNGIGVLYIRYKKKL